MCVCVTSHRGAGPEPSADTDVSRGDSNDTLCVSETGRQTSSLSSKLWLDIRAGHGGDTHRRNIDDGGEVWWHSTWQQMEGVYVHCGLVCAHTDCSSINILPLVLNDRAHNYKRRIPDGKRSKHVSFPQPAGCTLKGSTRAWVTKWIFDFTA